MCIGVELKVESMVRGVEKPQLIIETKVIATMRRTTKRRFAIAPWLGIVDVGVRWRGECRSSGSCQCFHADCED